MNYQEFIRKYCFLLVGGSITVSCILGIILFFSFKQSKPHVVEDELTMVSVSTTQSTEKNGHDQQIYVDIKGAVKKPGMYKGTENMRVWDAVILAGGVNEEADTKQVNFSKRISDQMIIYVPKIGEEVQAMHQSDAFSSNESLSQEPDKINLNQAKESELLTLPGIGQKKALEIIRYREENGGFKSIEDIKKISGFGEKTFEKLKDLLTV